MKTATSLPTFAALVIAACLGACDQIKAKKPASERGKPAKPWATRLVGPVTPVAPGLPLPLLREKA